MKMRLIVLFTLLNSCLLTACADIPRIFSNKNIFDIVIINGRVLDPETNLDAIRNIGIINGRISAITDAPLKGTQQINATGLIVSPGFIDLHSHAQNTVGQTYQVRDGVTTAVDLEWGYQLPKARDNREGKSLINYGTSACYYCGRFLAKGEDYKKTHHEIASENERYHMLSLIEGELNKGALGIGLPLDYLSRGINETEIEALFSLAARRNIPLFVHIRVAENPLDPRGFQEIIDLANKHSVSVHMAHIVSTGLQRVPLYIKMMDQARSKNVDITTELYPYTASSTGINSGIFDHNWQKKFSISYGDIEWPPTGERFTGKEMWDEYRAKYPHGTVIQHKMRESWVEAALKHPGIIVASDAMPLSSMDQRVHPRGMGTYARVLGYYVREKNVLNLSDAIRKMTYLPAKRLEKIAPLMKKKGRIQIGADADITIFDPNKIIDMATFKEPNQFSKGIIHVLVSGRVVVGHEIIVPGEYPGTAIYANEN